MTSIKVSFNKPYFTGREFSYIDDAFKRKHVSGNGYYTKKCQSFLEQHYGFKKCLLTTSCTDALEMAAILIDTNPRDEIIMPSYTFVSTANAFVLKGAKIRFVDSREDHPGMDEDQIEALINERTKAIVAVHYAGVACDMDKIMHLAKEHDLMVIEDAAQAIDSGYHGKPLGGIGHLGCFSFHETKNISCGEGGMLIINDGRFEERAEIVWEKGTNRAAFFRREVSKYGWVDVGSSFLPSDIIAAVLWAQLEEIETIQKRRKELWENYKEQLATLVDAGNVDIPIIPEYATCNGHLFSIICKNGERQELITALDAKGISSVFHYQALHQSDFFARLDEPSPLPMSEYYTQNLLRLPLYMELQESDQNLVIEQVLEFYQKDG